MNTLIRASAGSGKTYALTTEYLRLLRTRHAAPGGAGPRPEALLAATFTRKAAGEIADRVLSRLAAAALEDEKRAELAAAIADPALTTDACRELLLAVCRSLHRLSIGTLDSFFQQICGVYRQEAGLSGALRLSDPRSPRGRLLRRDAIRRMLGGIPACDSEDLLDDLNESKTDFAVLEAFDTLVAELLETADGVTPEAWDGLTAPPPPVEGEVAAALAALRAAQPQFKNGHWRNAVAADLERFEAGRWEEFAGKGLAAACLEGKGEYYRVPIPDEVAASYAVLLGAARHALLGALRRRTQAIGSLLGVFQHEYAALRRAEGLMLFSETPRLLLALLGDREETARRLDSPVEHLLLDEFQDTSDPQWNVLRHFALPAARGAGSVFVVGDVKQAIYGWRGGRAEIFERIADEVPDMAPQARNVSYRSSQVVLDAVNAVFAALPGCPAASEWAEACGRWHGHFQEHRAQRSLPGHVEMCEASGDGDHLGECAGHIAECVGRLPTTCSVGVLVRKNDTANALTDLLRAHGVAVSSEGSGAVADDPAVELMLSALTLADHPGHTAAAFHVAHSPLAAVLSAPPDLHARPADAAALSTALRRDILIHGYAGVLSGWATALAPYGPERTARRLEQVLDLATEFDGLPPMRADEFVRAVRDASVENPGAAPVRVMTINRSKGLEFDAVFLPELDWKASAGRRPAVLVRRAPPGASDAGHAVTSYPKELLRRLDPTLEETYRSLQEEEVTGLLCLLYVALTRARHALHLYVKPAGPGLTPAALLRHGLGGTPSEDGRLHASGDADWYQQVLWPETVAPSETPARPAFRFARTTGARRRGPAQGALSLGVTTAEDHLCLE